MSEHDSVNALEFAEKSLEIRGRISALELGRVVDYLSPEGGDLQYALKGNLDAQGVPSLSLHLHGWLGLVCHRCLGPLRFALDTQARFVLVRTEAELPPVEEERDDVDYLVADSALDVMAIIEDEVLLSLPMAPVHEEGQCANDVRAAREQKESPFKVLQGLKRAKE